MARRNGFAEQLQRLRRSKGLSALELSRRGGFSVNYVRSIERGLRYPQPDAVEKLARALELTGEERVAFFRAYDSGRTPQAIRDAAREVSVPGLVVWHRLPRLLWAVPHADGASAYSDPDRMLMHVVQAAASLLAWVALDEQDLTARQRSQLLKLGDAVRAATIGSHVPTLVSRGPNYRMVHAPDAYLWAALPQLWRRVLLSSDRSAADLVKRLKQWRYEPATPATGPRVSFTFDTFPRHNSYGLHLIHPRHVTTLHDALVAYRLIDRLGYDKPADLPLPLLKRSKLKDSIHRFLAPTNAELEKRTIGLAQSDADLRMARVQNRMIAWHRRGVFAGFVSRIFVCDAAAWDLFEEAPDAMRARIADRIVFVEDLPKRWPESPAYRAWVAHQECQRDTPEAAPANQANQAAP